MNIKQFWADVLSQNRERLLSYFHKDAVVRWHCSNELFTAQEYIQANCTYPGQWLGKIERIEKCKDLIITVVSVFPASLTETADATKPIDINGTTIINNADDTANDFISRCIFH